jgi:hypothetical protein
VSPSEPTPGNVAHVVLALGTSHSPLLALDPPAWEARARNDRVNQSLYDVDGTKLSYERLLERVGPKYASIAGPAGWQKMADAAQRSLDRLARDLADARPDVVVIVGDDEHELFTDANMPAISVFHGDPAISRRFVRATDPRASDPEYAWMKSVAQMYGMDENRRFATKPELARAFIDRLIEAGFDVAIGNAVPEPYDLGFGHAFGFVEMRLLGGRPVPIVPVILNTYYPPNQPTPARCYDLGKALRAAIEAFEPDLRVAIVASGGLSHFVTNEPLDTAVLDALRSGDEKTLRSIPTHVLNDGSSEIRCWITLGGMLDDLRHSWSEYVPVYRTEAGTGIGLAFGRWS